jgi:hypothetical protein
MPAKPNQERAPITNATATLRNVDTVFTAGAGYHSQANLKALAEQQINAYIPDNGYRKRDERYADQYVHAAKPDPLWNKAKQTKKSNCFKPADFRLADDHSHCVCPDGKRLYSNGSNCTINGYAAMNIVGPNKIAYRASGAKNVCAHQKRPQRGKYLSSKGNETSKKIT